MSMSMVLPSRTSHLWSLSDQALVSGTNFLTGVLLARVLGLEAFGAYVIAQMFLLYSNTFQGALVVSTMMTTVPAEREPAIRNRLIQGFFGYGVLVLVITVVGVQLIAWGIGRWSSALALGDLALPLAAAMVGYQLQDWLRRALYVDSANREVFASDVVAYGGQFVCIGLLAVEGRLTAVLALWCYAGAFLVSALGTLVSMRLRPTFADTLTVIHEHWRHSVHYLAANQLQWVASQGVILLGAGMIGQQAAGAVRAAQNLLGPVNVFFQWMDNVIPVRATVHFRERGRAALAEYLRRIGLIGVAALTAFGLILGIVDKPLIAALFGEEYRPYAILLVFWAMYYTVGHVYRMVSYFFRAQGITKDLAGAGVWWAIVSIAVAWTTASSLGERGIMSALVVGEVAALIYLTLRLFGQSRSGTHCVLRTLRGKNDSPQLVLPVGSSRLLRSAIAMYFPARWTGRLYRAFLAISLPWRARFGAIELVSSLDSVCPHLSKILAAVPGAKAEELAILVANKGPRTKFTIRFMDERAHVLAYARLAIKPEAMRVARREAEVLEAVNSTPASMSVPHVMAAMTFVDPEAFFLLESAGPDTPARPFLTQAHFKFLTGLLREDAMSWSDLTKALAAEVDTLPEPEDKNGLLARVIQLLREMQIDSAPSCIEHGDFAPWNIRQQGIDDLFVLDWEHSRLDGLPWFDALHFEFQMSALVRRAGPDVILRDLQSVFRLSAASPYASQVGVHVDNPRAFVAVYLLRMIVRAEREAKHWDQRIQPLGWDALGLWADGQTR
jgi:O-antigen/teichoic acid export membrane protein/aminoglycoside phosphotransferase (APT) family kinase protein